MPEQMRLQSTQDNLNEITQKYNHNNYNYNLQGLSNEAECQAASCNTEDFARRLQTLEKLCKNGVTKQCENYRQVYESMNLMCENMKCKWETDTKAEMCSTTCKVKDFSRRQEALIRLCREPDSEECKTYRTVYDNMKLICESMYCSHGVMNRRASSSAGAKTYKSGANPKLMYSLLAPNDINANVQDKVYQCEASCKTEDFARRQLVLERLCKEGDSYQCSTYKTVVHDMKTICDKMSCK